MARFTCSHWIMLSLYDFVGGPKPYMRFCGEYFHQTRGIPLGINPAVDMANQPWANYYLFCYKLQFVQQLVTLSATKWSLLWATLGLASG